MVTRRDSMARLMMLSSKGPLNMPGNKVKRSMCIRPAKQLFPGVEPQIGQCLRLREHRQPPGQGYTSVKERAISTKEYRVNEHIRAREVRLVGQEGMIGVVPMRDALNMARERGLDLVEVSPNADPPVCRLMDYGKFLYEKAKRERKARKAQKTVDVKEIRLRPKTGEHDVDFKLRDATRFLQQGYKVKVRIQFRGREITYPELGRELLEQFAQRLSEVSEIESPPRLEGRSMLMILNPSSRK